MYFIADWVSNWKHGCQHWKKSSMWYNSYRRKRIIIVVNRLLKLNTVELLYHELVVLAMSTQFKFFIMNSDKSFSWLTQKWNYSLFLAAFSLIYYRYSNTGIFQTKTIVSFNLDIARLVCILVFVKIIELFQ